MKHDPIDYLIPVWYCAIGALILAGGTALVLALWKWALQPAAACLL